MAPDDLPGRIEETRLADALSERYLAYAMSTIMSRSLPDVRDGLKPVHRRLVYAMHQLRLDPTSGFKKCARIVGDVMGKYHPHGDASIYDAMVRMAQEFAARYPLVEGQGNFGNIDGDNAAAMRYTEARLTEVAQALLAGIDENAVDFRPTYDGEEAEPLVLPGAFPNLLANGAAGIAVGMATSIPPHNAGEVCAAAIHLIANPEASTAELLAHMPGPDFPTGGTLVEDKAALLQAYETGRGGFRLRAKWEIERGRLGTWVIVVTEIPYQVQKSRLIEQIAQLLEDKKLPLLGDVVVLLFFEFFIAGIVGVQIFSGALGHNCAALINPRPECVGCDHPFALMSDGGLPPMVAPDGGAAPHAPLLLYNATAAALYNASGEWLACPPGCSLPEQPVWRVQAAVNFGDDLCAMPRAPDYPRRGGADNHLRGHYCKPGWWCVTNLPTVNYGITSFDNVLWAWLTVFQCLTLTNWTDIMYQMQDTVCQLAWIYFVRPGPASPPPPRLRPQGCGP